jgi:type II secretory pathway component PulM
MSLANQLRAELAPYIDPLRQRWEQMPPMDRLVWSVLAGVSTVVVLVFGIWLPSHHATQRARQEYQNNQELLGYIQANAARAQAAGGVVSGGSDSILTVVNNSAAANGFTLRRFEPQGDRVRIWLDGVGFNKVAGWLNQLSQQGVNAVSAEVEKQQDTGLVSVTLTLSR